MTISTYEQQAQKFMDDTQTTMEVKLIGSMPYFDNDKENRDVYQITLKRNGKIYSFRFGQAIANSSEFVQKESERIEDERGLQAAFQHRKKNLKLPTAYDVLAAITKNDPGTFKDFCSEVGYDEDSRKAEKTYFAVQNEWSGINNFFHDVLDQLQEIS